MCRRVYARTAPGVPSAALETTPSSPGDPRAIRLLRLHSLSGVAPVAAFFALHLWIQARALGGRRAYDSSVGTLMAIPGRAVVELLFVFLPLSFHAGYGISMMLGRAPGHAEPPGAQPWSRQMQRVTGITTAAFIVLHVAAIRVPAWLGRARPADYYPRLVTELSTTTVLGVPAWSAAYLLGLAAVSYHLANGLTRFCLRLGLGESGPKRRAIALGTGLLGAALFLLGTNTVVYFATGAPLFDRALLAN